MRDERHQGIMGEEALKKLEDSSKPGWPRNVGADTLGGLEEVSYDRPRRYLGESLILLYRLGGKDLPEEEAFRAAGYLNKLLEDHNRNSRIRGLKERMVTMDDYGSKPMEYFEDRGIELDLGEILEKSGEFYGEDLPRFP